MKALLDECLPRMLKQHLSIHECRTVPELGWAGKKNGELISVAEQKGFEVFLTVDQGIEYEQNLAAHRVGTILIRSKSSRLSELVNYIPQILNAISAVRPGQLIRIPSR